MSKLQVYGGVKVDVKIMHSNEILKSPSIIIIANDSDNTGFNKIVDDENNESEAHFVLEGPFYTIDIITGDVTITNNYSASNFLNVNAGSNSSLIDYTPPNSAQTAANDILNKYQSINMDQGSKFICTHLDTDGTIGVNIFTATFDNFGIQDIQAAIMGMYNSNSD